MMEISILVRLDNKIPSIAVNPIVGEVSGDVRVDYVVSDVEGDSVRLRVE